MIKMSYLEVMHPGFREAANVIWNSPNLDGHTAYSAHRIKKGIDKVLKESKKLQEDMAGKYCQKRKLGPADDAPEILLRDERGQLLFKDEASAKAFEEEFETTFSDKFFELQVTKIDFQKIGGVKGLTPNHWAYLEPVIDNLPKEAPEKQQDSLGLLKP